MKIWKLSEKSFAKCDKVFDDYTRLNEYMKDVFERPDFEQYIERNTLANLADIEEGAKQMWDSWQAGNYFTAGGWAAAVNVEQGLAPEWGRSQMAPALWVDGQIFGLTG